MHTMGMPVRPPPHPERIIVFNRLHIKLKLNLQFLVKRNKLLYANPLFGCSFFPPTKLVSRGVDKARASGAGRGKESRFN